MAPSTVGEIEQLIRNQVQENIHLDYKASKAISLAARDEIAKDVSAFANSDGGVLIYGVEEDRDTHLPVKIDGGVDDSVCTKEWIENTITSRITPKLMDVHILPLPVSPGRSIYVISVAKSLLGPHQASDKRFYKRHNFKSEPMEEHELRFTVIPRESPNSLRRRTTNLADEVDLFLQGRWNGRPQNSGGDTEDQQKEQRRYSQETEDLYLVRFRERIVAIIQELQSKGIVVGKPYLGTITRSLMPDEIQLLRNLAYRLDHKDELVRF